MARRAKPTKLQKTLSYKVIELSNVDEAALEATVNEWVGAGWAFDGIQFAMRESSKRPAMAFVFFTRVGQGERFRTQATAEAHLKRLVLGDEAKGPKQRSAADAYARLAQLANDSGEDEP